MLKKTKQFFKDLFVVEEQPEVGTTRLRYVFILTDKLEGDRRWFGWHWVEEEAQETVECIEVHACYDVVRFIAVRWCDDRH